MAENDPNPQLPPDNPDANAQLQPDNDNSVLAPPIPSDNDNGPVANAGAPQAGAPNLVNDAQSFVENNPPSNSNLEAGAIAGAGIRTFPASNRALQRATAQATAAARDAKSKLDIATAKQARTNWVMRKLTGLDGRVKKLDKQFDRLNTRATRLDTEIARRNGVSPARQAAPNVQTAEAEAQGAPALEVQNAATLETAVPEVQADAIARPLTIVEPEGMADDAPRYYTPDEQGRMVNTQETLTDQARTQQSDFDRAQEAVEKESRERATWATGVDEQKRISDIAARKAAQDKAAFDEAAAAEQKAKDLVARRTVQAQRAADGLPVEDAPPEDLNLFQRLGRTLRGNTAFNALSDVQAAKRDAAIQAKRVRKLKILMDKSQRDAKDEADILAERQGGLDASERTLTARQAELTEAQNNLDTTRTQIETLERPVPQAEGHPLDTGRGAAPRSLANGAQAEGHPLDAGRGSAGRTLTRGAEAESNTARVARVTRGVSRGVAGAAEGEIAGARGAVAGAAEGGLVRGAARALGPVGLLLGVGIGSYDVYKGYQAHDVHRVADAVGSTVGGIAAGFAAGAGLGALLGVETGPGALVTGLIGGVVGGVAGAFVGKAAMEKFGIGATQAVMNWVDKRLGRKTPPPAQNQQPRPQAGPAQQQAARGPAQQSAAPVQQQAAAPVVAAPVVAAAPAIAAPALPAAAQPKKETDGEGDDDDGQNAYSGSVFDALAGAGNTGPMIISPALAAAPVAAYQLNDAERTQVAAMVRDVNTNGADSLTFQGTDTARVAALETEARNDGYKGDIVTNRAPDPDGQQTGRYTFAANPDNGTGRSLASLKTTQAQAVTGNDQLLSGNFNFAPPSFSTNLTSYNLTGTADVSSMIRAPILTTDLSPVALPSNFSGRGLHGLKLDTAVALDQPAIRMPSRTDEYDLQIASFAPNNGMG